MSIKKQLVDRLESLLDEKITNAKKAIQSLKESRDGDSKSSAGDKHEVGRAMAQIEMDNIQKQLNQSISLKQEILKILPDSKFDKVGFGSVVMTNQFNYFISIGMGKISINQTKVFCVSKASPIGNLLLHKKAGDIFSFQDKEITILEVY